MGTSRPWAHRQRTRRRSAGRQPRDRAAPDTVPRRCWPRPHPVRAVRQPGTSPSAAPRRITAHRRLVVALALWGVGIRRLDTVASRHRQQFGRSRGDARRRHAQHRRVDGDVGDGSARQFGSGDGAGDQRGLQHGWYSGQRRESGHRFDNVVTTSCRLPQRRTRPRFHGFNMGAPRRCNPELRQLNDNVAKRSACLMQTQAREVQFSECTPAFKLIPDRFPGSRYSRRAASLYP